jgi:hypothetical protein
VETEIPDKGVSITSGPNGGVGSIFYPGGDFFRNSDGTVSAGLPNEDTLTIRPDGSGVVTFEGDQIKITSKGDGPLTISQPVIDPNTGRWGAAMTTTYLPDGTIVTTKPGGTPISEKKGVVNGGTTTFPDGISITKKPSGRVETEIPDKGVSIASRPSGGGVYKITLNDDFHFHKRSDGTVDAQHPNGGTITILPDGTGKVELGDDDYTVITSKGDGPLTISESVIDPNTGYSTGAYMGTTYTPPP